ncbi:MAG TPA: ABC transporter permease subunit [Candidatus Angelobacter sp.]|nr:ABC transporter permease subunit [Candidatus Angelobacter sp.]
MAVYKRTYKAYRGPLTPAWSRFTVLSRYGLKNLFDSRPFTAFTVLCFVPFMGWLIATYVVHSTTAQLAFGIRLGAGVVGNMWFLGFLVTEAWMGFILAAWGGPGMITKDFANHSVQLYLSRPLSRVEYLFGKASVLFVLLSCISWVPGLILFFVQAGLEGHGWIWDNLWLAGAIFLSCLIGIAMVSLLSMAVAVWVKWRIAATALMFAVFFLFPALGAVISLILRTRWGHLLNFPVMIMIIWGHLFRITPARPDVTQPGFFIVPVWAAWASALSVCAICFWLLHRKLKAREVERS